jgi:hypothetical protein
MIRDEMIDERLSGQDPQAVFVKDGMLDALKMALAEQVLNAELDYTWPASAPERGPRPRATTATGTAARPC